MKWTVYFDDGSTESFHNAQLVSDISKKYIERLKIKPLFALINGEGYAMNALVRPVKKLKVRIIHSKLARMKIVASYSIGNVIIENIKHKFNCQNVVLKEFGNHHFTIIFWNIDRIKVLQYLKKQLKKDLKICLNTKEECVYHNAHTIFQEPINYNAGQEVLAYDDLINFQLEKWLEENGKTILFFQYYLEKDDNLLNLTKGIKKTDHRILGKELDLFYLKGESAPGMPYWLPKGLIIKNEIKKYLQEEQRKEGFLEVETPIVGTEQLYQQSGHLNHYQNEMFKLHDEQHGAQYLRPMACPHHCDLFKRIPRTHKDLPLKYSEYAKLYRKEKRGGLVGLERVTSMELSDAHIFCAEKNVKNQIKDSFELIQRVLKNLGIHIHQYTIAIRDYFDTKGYGGDPEIWLKAEKQIIDLANEMNLNYQIVVGEAAFYGPKIDLEVISPHGSQLTTISTIQIDFFLPKKFELTYLDEKKQKHYVVMIHRGIASTFERLVAFMLTQNNGYFPLRFAPIQVVIIPISIMSKKIIEYANQIYNKLTNEGFRCQLDLSDETIAKKIRRTQKLKRNYSIIIGETELKDKTISIRQYQFKETSVMKLLDFIKKLKGEVLFVK